MSKREFTPTEDLVLEVLIARWRLGELLWTFDSQASPAIEKLADKGWVTSMHGITENTVRATLTSKAVAKWLVYDYIPPIARGNEKLEKRFRKVVKQAKKAKKRLKAEHEAEQQRCQDES